MKRRIAGMCIAVVLILGLSPVMSAAGLPQNPITPKTLEAVFIHYEHPAKGGKPAPPPLPKVYDYYLLLGPKWDLTKYPSGVPYVINPAGAPAGAELEVKAAFDAWDAATSTSLFDDNPIIDSNSWWGRLDGKNNVSWQVIADGSAIAATWIWYYDNDNSGGMSDGDEIRETDMVFNASKQWGVDSDGEGNASKLRNMYDVRNIATHEGGHVVGLDDIYDIIYSEITMYGYGAKGETKKISLELGDINGTRAIYGL